MPHLDTLSGPKVSFQPPLEAPPPAPSPPHQFISKRTVSRAAAAAAAWFLLRVGWMGGASPKLESQPSHGQDVRKLSRNPPLGSAGVTKFTAAELQSPVTAQLKHFLYTFSAPRPSRLLGVQSSHPRRGMNGLGLCSHLSSCKLMRKPDP